MAYNLAKRPYTLFGLSTLSEKRNLMNQMNNVYPFRTAWRDLLSDLDRYRFTDGRSLLSMFIMSPGSLACLSYRIGRWIWCYSGPLAALTVILKVLYILANRVVEITTGISITPRAQIGAGLYIGHFGEVFVGEGVIMGINCNLSQGVTIGISGRGDKRGSPQLGDRVYIAPGAKLFGKITLGDDSAVGANAVVSRSLPVRAVAVGIPAKVISLKGSFEYILYRQMENDPVRLNSIAQAEQDSEAPPEIG